MSRFLGQLGNYLLTQSVATELERQITELNGGSSPITNRETIPVPAQAHLFSVCSYTYGKVPVKFRAHPHLPANKTSRSECREGCKILRITGSSASLLKTSTTN